MPFSIGKLLDNRYEIQRLLGTGGMGEVYQAMDLRLGRAVAIKVLPEHLASDADALGRFELEAKILAALSHPNIRAIYDMGHEEAFHFAVMELLEGETLRRRMESGPLGLPEILRVAELIAEGLAAAHTKGIIHRDLKPENVFFTTDGQVKLLDYGLARLTREGAERLHSGQELTTSPGLVMGTAAYMAPEQVRGQSLDPRCDLFAFGCLLFEMLMDRRPFVGESVAEILASILKDPVPKISSPPELRRLVESCLEKDRLRRMVSASEAAGTIRTLRAVYPTEGSVSPLTSPIRRSDIDLPTEALSRFSQDPEGMSRPRMEGFLDALMGLWPFHSKVLSSIAVLPFENPSGDFDSEYLAAGIAEGLLERLALVPGLRVAPWSVVWRYQGRQVDLQALGRRLRVRGILTGRLIQRGTDLEVSVECLDVRTLSHLWGEHYKGSAAGLLEAQAQLFGRIAERLSLKVSAPVLERIEAVPTEDPEAFRLYLKGRHAWRMRSAEALQDAVKAFQEALDRDPEFALAYAGLADAYTLLSFLVGVVAPMDTMTQASAAVQRALELRPNLAEAHASLAMIHESFEWDWIAAESAHLRALELRPGNPNLLHRYGLHLLYQGRFEGATQRFQAAGKLDPLSPLIQVAQGLVPYFQGKSVSAITAFRQAVAFSPHFLIGHLMLGLALEQGGHAEEAIQSFQRALDIAETPDGLAMMGHALALVGRREEAMAILERLQKLSATSYVNDYGPAVVRLALGDREGALSGLEQATATHCELMVYLGIDPRLDPLRGEPRFEVMLAKVGLKG